VQQQVKQSNEYLILCSSKKSKINDKPNPVFKMFSHIISVILQRSNYFLPFFQGGSCTLSPPNNALTGISTIFNRAFKVFPNPAISELTISKTAQSENLIQKGAVQIEMYSTTGQLLRKAIMMGSDFIMKTGDLSNGFYYLKTYTSGATKTQPASRHENERFHCRLRPQ
jgi:hypothetical protein